MRTTQKIFTVAATLVVVLGIGVPAVADCGANPGVISTQGAAGVSQIFTQEFAEGADFFYGGYGATRYCGGYNGCTPVSPNLQASFWSEGLGDPTPLQGVDNGTFDLVGAGQVSFDAFASVGYYAGATIQSGWAAGTDGCIGSGNCLCMLLTDTNGADTFFAVVSGISNTGFTTSINRGGTDGSGNFNAPIIMERVAAPSITGSTRVGTDLLLDVVVNAPASGVYTADGGGCACGPTGYKVLQQLVPRGNMPPSDRSTGWTDASAVTAIGSSIVDLSVTCGAADQDVYLTTELFFDSGFSTSLVSGNSSRVECGTTLADPDDRPRQRPSDIRPSQRTRGGRGR